MANSGRYFSRSRTRATSPNSSRSLDDGIDEEKRSVRGQESSRLLVSARLPMRLSLLSALGHNGILGGGRSCHLRRNLLHVATMSFITVLDPHERLKQGSEYTCFECGQTFEVGPTEEEAFDECQAIFGEDRAVLEPRVVVCDDCWREKIEPELKRNGMIQ